MKIAVAATGPGLDARTDPRFGRCACFLIVDTETLTFELLENSASMGVSGAGVAAAQLVASSGASVVATWGLGVTAFHVLRSAGIEVFRTSASTVRLAVEEYRAGMRWRQEG